MTDFYGRPYGYNYQNPYANAYQAQMAAQQAQAQSTQMRTNKIFVTSLDDALGRYADPNTIMVYYNQDEKYLYEITTDGYGKKTYKTLELRQYSAPQSENKGNAVAVSKEEFDAVKSRLDGLEREVLKKYKENKGDIE